MGRKQNQYDAIIPFAPAEEPNWERAEILFVLNINAGDRKIPLEIHQNDKPSELAEYFCCPHNLPMGVASQLTTLIHTHKIEFERENMKKQAKPPPSPSPTFFEDDESSNFSHFAPHPPPSCPPENDRLKKTKKHRFRRFRRTTKAPKIIHNENLKKKREQNFVPSSPSLNGTGGEDETLNQFKLLIDDYYKNKCGKKKGREKKEKKKKKKKKK